jgi:hypothetical protein
VTLRNRQLLAKYSRRALELFRKRIALGPVASARAQASVLAQLEWLTDFAEGRNEQRSRFKDLVFFAKEDADTGDSELDEALYAAGLAADFYVSGLKIDAMMPPNTSFERTREG